MGSSSEGSRARDLPLSIGTGVVAGEGEGGVDAVGEEVDAEEEGGVFELEE